MGIPGDERPAGALSKIVKPAKGKSYVHHEGTFEMPFVLTFNVPSLCPAAD